MSKIEQELAELENQKEKLLGQLEVQRGNKTFRCGCGVLHKIKDCVVIQTHWYESPSGCSGGDFWHTDELKIVCPETNIRNRVYFPSPPYEHRKDYSYNMDTQFSRNYKHLFKQVIDEYENSPPDTRVYRNIDYFVKNYKRFGLTNGPEK